MEGDGQLLKFMENVSKNLEQRAMNVKTNINRMLLNADETNVKLSNINNKLSALQNSQFVENRVYEEDETISNVAEVPCVPAQKPPTAAVDAVNAIVDSGLKVLQKMYDKVTIELDDSDDETGDSRKKYVCNFAVGIFSLYL